MRPLAAALGVAGMWPRLCLLLAVVAVAFLALGGDSIASSSRAVLHGLCAQRPSHSFTIGGQALPFDARMTGIYTGALWTWAVLAQRGRLLAAGTPPRSVIVVLVATVCALGVDGVNALAVDLGMWHPYEPMNVVRFLTGFGTGLSLVSLEVWLIGGSLWKLASQRPLWDSLISLWWAVPAAFITIVLILLDMEWSYVVMVSLLLVSAWITVSGLVLVIVATLFRVDKRATSVRRLELPLILSAVGGLAIIIALAQLRFWLERTLGIPQDFEPIASIPPGSILAAMSSFVRGLIAA
ncbi:MAG: DUF2085 domain-containing protein [Chloroflexota bacterium]|nr:DUF2085 domain-containing protein [Chloroflexota bacterium]